MATINPSITTTSMNIALDHTPMNLLQPTASLQQKALDSSSTIMPLQQQQQQQQQATPVTTTNNKAKSRHARTRSEPFLRRGSLDMLLFGNPCQSPLKNPIRITRLFDIRRVENSETELVLSLDVPANISVNDLQVHIEQDKPDDDLYRVRVSSTAENRAKTFPLHAASIDLHQVKAVLNTTRNELEIIAPKIGNENSTQNPFLSMAVDVLQSLAQSVSNASWNSNQVLRKVPITTLNEEKDSVRMMDESSYQLRD